MAQEFVALRTWHYTQFNEILKLSLKDNKPAAIFMGRGLSGLRNCAAIYPDKFQLVGAV
jgi:hypothetical protein